MEVIKVNNISKIYDNRKVLDNLSFEVPENCICGFLGPNGAGKTTTFKLLTGLIDSDEGNIKIMGEEITTKNQSNNLRFLQDVPEFYNYMTTYEYLKFICELNNLKKIDTLIKETLELVGLEDSINKRIGSFSRGMKQRIGIAATIISKPKILLLDEPISALDPIGRKEMFDLFKNLKGKMTILFSTHIIDDIERICDKIIIINKGKKVVDSSVANTKNKYLKEYIKIVFLNKKDIKDFMKSFKENNEIYHDEETMTLNIKTDNIKNSQNSIFKILDKEKIAVNELSVVTPTLEEIFMEEVLK